MILLVLSVLSILPPGMPFSSADAYIFNQTSPAAHQNMSYVFLGGFPFSEALSNDVPYTDAVASSGNSRVSDQRGSGILVLNEYLTDPEDNKYSRIIIDLNGNSAGVINDAFFVLGQAFSIADYAFTLTGGTGSIEATVSFVTDLDTYPSGKNASAALVFDGSGNELYDSSDENAPESIVLNFGEAFLIRAVSGGAFFEMNDADYAFDSLFTMDVLQTNPIPIPSTVLLFVCGVIGLCGLNKGFLDHLRSLNPFHHVNALAARR